MKCNFIVYLVLIYFLYFNNIFAKKLQKTVDSVRYFNKNHQIKTSYYQYNFNPHNYMEFDKISVNIQDEIHTVTEDSKLYIKADIKNFFTLDFNSSDIISSVESYRNRKLSSLLDVSFYLKVLFFKINISLNTEFKFFTNSAYIPMQITLPVNAKKWLNPKSGMLYSWKLNKSYLSKDKKIKMPHLDSNILFDKLSSFVELGLAYCKIECIYKYHIRTHNKVLQLDFKIPKPLVKLGFFPFYVRSVNEYKKVMNWDFDYKNQREGLYFDNSNLPKGSHSFKFLISIKENKNKNWQNTKNKISKYQSW